MPSALDDLRELARQDDRLAQRAARLHGLDTAVAAIGKRAEEIAAFFAGREPEDERLRKLEAGARTELDRRHAHLADAKADLASAQSDEARALLRRRSARAADRIEVATGHLEQVRELQDAHQRLAEELAGDLPRLEARANALADELPRLPAPSASPDGLGDWASRAHAVLFVTVSQLDTQRERVIREANELASARLGEPTYGSTPAQALARVERSSVSSSDRIGELAE